VRARLLGRCDVALKPNPFPNPSPRASPSA
jgi:hypothetical protein